ncbi:MAG: hypothetical protein ACFB6S_18870 [Geminicoccaceae bacterium]
MVSHTIMASAGAILLASLAAEWLARRTELPRVTLLILIGIGAGPYGLGAVPTVMRDATDLIAVDDAWGLIAPGLAIAAVGVMVGSDTNGAWVDVVRHIGGAVAVGLLVGRCPGFSAVAPTVQRAVSLGRPGVLA